MFSFCNLLHFLGSVPSVNDGVVTRKACLPTIDCTSDNYEIKLKNCGQYTAYFLKRPDTCDQAYCFGKYEYRYSYLYYCTLQSNEVIVFSVVYLN